MPDIAFGESLKIMEKYCNSKNKPSLSDVLGAIENIIAFLKRFYLFKYPLMLSRKMLFVMKDQSISSEVRDCFIRNTFNSNKKLFLSAENLPKNPGTIITNIISITDYDANSRITKPDWKLQYQFECCILCGNSTLQAMIDYGLSQHQSIPELIKKVKGHLETVYKLQKDLDQLQSYISRTLFGLYYYENTLLLKYKGNDENFKRNSELLRCFSPKQLGASGNFFLNEEYETAIKDINVFHYSIKYLDQIAFYYIPDDITYQITQFFDLIREEADLMVRDTLEQKKGIDYRRERIDIGIDELLPLIIIVLLKSTAPFLSDLFDIISDPESKIRCPTKSLFSFSNYIAAYLAILQWDFGV